MDSQIFISAIKQFYVNNTQFIKLDGETTRSFNIHSGVRQGCPMSPVLFALALDPFLDHLCKVLPAGDLARAYADDMALVMDHGDRAVPKVFELVQQFGLISNVSLNFRKIQTLRIRTRAQTRTRKTKTRTNCILV